MKIFETFREYTDTLRDTGYRGLAFITSADIESTVSNIISSCDYDRILAIASMELRKNLSRLVSDDRVLYASYIDVNKLLGSEYDMVIVVSTGYLRPNLIALLGKW